jgi:AcrR family transcriptional regulator
MPPVWRRSACAAGIQRGALYYHIGSKEELLWEVLRPHVEEARRAAQAIAQADLEPVEKLRRLIHDHVQTIAIHRPSVVTYLRDRDGLSASRRAELEALRDEVEGAWRQIIEEGVRAGAFRTADPVVVNGLLGLVNMVYLWYRPGGSDTPDDIAEKFTDLVTCGLLTEQARLRRWRPADCSGLLWPDHTQLLSEHPAGPERVCHRVEAPEQRLSGAPPGVLECVTVSNHISRHRVDRWARHRRRSSPAP